MTNAQNATAPESTGGNSILGLQSGNKVYTIKYDITGGKFNGISVEKDNKTQVANLSSISNGKFIIELPRNVIDSKK